METNPPLSCLQYFLNGRGLQSAPSPGRRLLVGVLEGNGIGPEVTDAALRVAAAAAGACGVELEIRRGGLIGEQAEAEKLPPLPEAVVQFCGEVFEAGGAILNGPGGGRYVYDLRRRFDLFCKFVPVQPWPELAGAGRLIGSHLKNVNMLIVRDNIGGVYQGEWRESITPEGRIAEHRFHYSEPQIYRLVEIAARAAAHRHGRLHIIVKEGGVPGISALWRDVGMAVARKFSVKAAVMNVDLAAYELIQHPQLFDVLVAPNLIGDIMADVAGVLVASRGLTFSGNYTPEGHGVYQTNHGCAHDLAGTDRANPAGQILSMAMLLRESFGLERPAALMERALARCWADGWRTEDIAETGSVILGTQAMTGRVVDQVLQLAEAKLPA